MLPVKVAILFVLFVCIFFLAGKGMHFFRLDHWYARYTKVTFIIPANLAGDGGTNIR